MSGQRKHRKVERRNDTFSQRPVTKIWQELSTTDNPYNATTSRCHGYDHLELLKKRSFTDVLFLLFRSELPSPEQAELLEKLMVCLINPGPRHPATKAAMMAGVGKSDSAHILPIALTVLAGERLGACEVEKSLRFLRKSRKHAPESFAQQLIETSHPPSEENDTDEQLTPGFGCRFSGMDLQAKQFAEQLALLPGAGKCLSWGLNFAATLESTNKSWLMTGVAAATLADLGFPPRAAAGLFQLFSGPGLLAHGLEMANKPFTAMPFPDDEDYIIEK